MRQQQTLDSFSADCAGKQFGWQDKINEHFEHVLLTLTMDEGSTHGFLARLTITNEHPRDPSYHSLRVTPAMLRRIASGLNAMAERLEAALQANA